MFGGQGHGEVLLTHTTYNQTDRQIHILIKFIVVWGQPVVGFHSSRQECWQTVKSDWWVLTTCQIWLMGVDKVTNTCQIYYLKWWLIDIQSILLIDIRKNQYNRTTINQVTASDEFDLQREPTDRQTNRRGRWFLYIIKKIYTFYHKQDYLFTRMSLTYTHYIDTNTQYRAAPRRPP